MFPPITFETWGRCQSVRLVRTHLLICNLTYLSEYVTLTLGDLRSKLPSNLCGSQSRSVDPPWPGKDDGGKISALSQIAKKLLTKKLYEIDVSENGAFFVWPDLECQRLTKIGHLAHHLIRNVPKLVVVAKLYHTQERDCAGDGNHPPRCVLVWWKRRCGRGLKSVMGPGQVGPRIHAQIFLLSTKELARS